jgi:hypothetical protein
MMGTNEDQVIGVIEEMPDRLHFRRACRLSGAERIEADDHNAVDTVERDIERRHCARIVYALDLNDLAARQPLGLFGKRLEIRLLDEIQKAGDALIGLIAIRQSFELGVKEPAQLENRWKTIVNHGKWRAGLRWTAPGEIEKYLSTAHPLNLPDLHR